MASIDYNGAERVTRTTRSYLTAHGTNVQRVTTDVVRLARAPTLRTSFRRDLRRDRFNLGISPSRNQKESDCFTVANNRLNRFDTIRSNIRLD
jgi:hypothetical protein